jgi:hypothetical protein
MVGIAMLSAPFLLLGGFFAYRIGGEYLARTEFDGSAWQEAAEPADAFPRNATRLRMVDDLLERYDLAGMTRSEVTALLGESDDARLGPDEQLWDMVYYLGPERGLLGLDSEWLAIRLSKDDRVDEHRIVIP